MKRIFTLILALSLLALTACAVAAFSSAPVRQTA